MIEFILACFAVFRLAELIAVDDGPGDMLLWMRAELGAYNIGEDGRPDTSIGRFIICPWCIGIWLSALTAMAIAPSKKRMGLWWFAIAGGAAFLQRIGGRV